MARGRARRSWRPGSRVAFAVRGQPPRAAWEGRLGAHRGPGKPCLNRLSTCGGRRIPVSLSKWDNQDEAHSRGRELLARHRRTIMRKARSKKKRPLLLAELERRYRESPVF